MISADMLLVKRYDKDQPRAPKGSPDGGQWVSGASSASPSVEHSVPADGHVAHDTVPKKIVKFIENYTSRQEGARNRHASADLMDALAKEFSDELTGMIDKIPEDKRPTVLLHKGDEEKGIPTVWLLGWSSEEGTDIHDHKDSEVGIHVLRGAVSERVFACGKGCEDPRGAAVEAGDKGIQVSEHSRDLRAGSSLGLKAPYIHEVAGLSPKSKRDVTVHGYFPPLDRMTYYTYNEKTGRLVFDGEWEEGKEPTEEEKKKVRKSGLEAKHLIVGPHVAAATGGITSKMLILDKEYDPNQPRAPKGSPTGGQWVSDASPMTSLSDYAKKYDKDVSPEQIFARFSEEDRKLFSDKLAEALKQKDSRDIYLDQKTGMYTPERQKLHDKIVEHFLSDENIKAATPSSGDPSLVVLGGRGGSGKSSFLRDKSGASAKLNEFDSKNYIVLDSDEIKSRLRPPYEGFNAAKVHEEADDVFNRILHESRQRGLNIVLDMTLKTYEKAEGLVRSFTDRGYKAQGHYMFLPRDKAAERAVSRFLHGYRSEKKEGRLVPPFVILGNTKNEENFDKLKPFFTRWSAYDNQGDAPVRIGGSK